MAFTREVNQGCELLQSRGKGLGRGSLELEGLAPVCAFWLLFSCSLGSEGPERCEQGLQKGLGLWGWEHAGHPEHCPGCFSCSSSQSVQQFESLLPVLLGAASGTFISRLLLGMADSCFGRAKLMGSSSDTLVAAISTAGTQSISA